MGSRKIMFLKIISGPRKFCSKKIFGPKNILYSGKKIFGLDLDVDDFNLSLNIKSEEKIRGPICVTKHLETDD